MTVSLEMPTVSHSPLTDEIPPRGRMLMRVLALLDEQEVPYCVLHGYEQFPKVIRSDVDMLIPADFLPDRLAKILHVHRETIGARAVQWFIDGAHFIVLAGPDEENNAPVLLQLHASTQYEMGGRVFFDAEQILSTRRKHNGFWVPAFDIEMACVLANRFSKSKLTTNHTATLASLYGLDREKCDAQVRRLFPRSHATVIQAITTDDWNRVCQSFGFLREELLASPASKQAGSRNLIGKIFRWLRPRNGFHAVFLGPDGVGKSTTIEAFQRDLEPVFLSKLYLTFAPGLLPQKFSPPKPKGPHSLPPRSLPASLLKAAWWFVCYTLGYFLTIHPTLARGGLVVNHRYLVDAIVDQKRYRYRGPVWLLKMIWTVAPKPDVVFLLDAPAEIIQSRKQEVTFEETAAQVTAYRTAIGELPIGKIIDASQPRPQVAAEVEWIVLGRLADRVARQFSLGVQG